MKKNNDTGDVGKIRKDDIIIPDSKRSESFSWFSQRTFQSKMRAVDIQKKPFRLTGRRGLFGRNLFLSLFALTLVFGALFVWSASTDKPVLERVVREISSDFSEGVGHLKLNQFDKAEQSFRDASTYIASLREAVRPIRLENTGFPFEPPEWSHLLDLSYQFAEAGVRVSRLLPELFTVPDLLISKKGEELLALFAKAEGEAYLLRSLVTDTESALTTAGFPVLGRNIAQKRQELIIELKTARGYLDDFLAAVPAIRQLLGVGAPHTTAVFFQNSGEIRATGGFPGSMALVTIDRGVDDSQFYDIYYFGWRNNLFLPPPSGFERLTDRLFLRDANSFFDFPASAEQMRMMLLASEGPVADSVVTVSDDLFRELLRLTGPIPLPGVEEELMAENGSMVLSFLVEAKASGLHTPKQIIAEMIPVLFEKVESVPPEKLLALFRQAVKRKWILANSVLPDVQVLFRNSRISGEVLNPPAADYLAVVSANVGGNKSDHFLEEEIETVSSVTLDGEVTESVTITRRHLWGAKHEKMFADLLSKHGNYHVEAEVLRKIAGAGENHSYTQVFAPLGSNLVRVEGVPYESVTTSVQAQKTVFGFRFPKLPAGEERNATLTYRLPTMLTFPARFDLYYQTQPGRDSVSITRRIVVEAGLSLSDSGIAKATIDSDGLFLSEISK